MFYAAKGRAILCLSMACVVVVATTAWPSPAACRSGRDVCRSSGCCGACAASPAAEEHACCQKPVDAQRVCRCVHREEAPAAPLRSQERRGHDGWFGCLAGPGFFGVDIPSVHRLPAHSQGAHLFAAPPRLQAVLCCWLT